ncbi:MAG: 4-(cytidine 5'-diphospho)-2-C-methyl-D-erythritol kinase [Nitrospira sp.]|nr:4-(cytidine 5'-diphospho)-2-C-methyl-D-erythritol kinase [Nitrospira sp.]
MIRRDFSPRQCIPDLPSRSAPLYLRAPAKINWFLKIVGKRDDGFHNIISLMQSVNLYDSLVIEHADSVDIATDPDIPLHDNIVYKTVNILKKHTHCTKGARIQLKKKIPVGAGLGGGSSDAAYALSGLNTLWGLQLSQEELNAIGAEIGSDVPFFLNGTSALVEGRGEKVTPLKIQSSVMLLLVKPPVSVSTAWAYTSFDKFDTDKLTKKPFDIKLFCQALNRKDFASLGKMLDNDLEEVVAERYPVIRQIRQKLTGTGAAISGMSGSGSTVFGVFENKDKAAAAAKTMKPNWYSIVETLLRVES